MKDEDRTKSELIRELKSLRRQVKRITVLESKREQTEEALRESEEKYRNMVERAHDGITIIQDGKTRYANPAIAEMWGGTVEEVMGTPFTDYVYPEDLPRVLERYKTRMTGNEVEQFYETLLRRRDGSKAYAELKASIITFHGKPASLIVLRDITERKRTEEALEGNEKRYRELFDFAPIGYHELDIQGRITRVNHTELEMLGYTEEEMIGEFVWKFVGDENTSRLRVLQKLEGIIPPSKGEERSYLRKDRTSLHVLAEDRILHDAANCIAGIRTTLQDITLHKRMELSLRVSEEKYRKFFEDDLSGDYISTPQGKILDCNQAFATMLGCRSIEAALNSDVETFYEQSSDRQGFLDRLRREKKLFNYEEVLQRQDGRSITVLENVIGRFDSRGELISFQGYIFDITERKQAEKQIMMLAQAVRSINECVSITDKNNNIVFVNLAFLNTYGYTEQELLGKNISLIRSAKVSEEKSEKILQLSMEGGWHGELINKRKDGSEFPISLSSTMIHDHEGKPVALIGVATDITERKQVEEALRNNEHKLAEVNQMLQLVLDTIPVRIFWKDKDCVYVGCNRLFAEDAGRKNPAELIGDTDFNMGWHEQAVLYRKDDMEVMSSEKPKLAYEEPQTAPDGKQIWLRTSKIPLYGTDNRIIGIMGTYEDITERKRAEEAVRESEERFRTTLYSIGDGVITTDINSNVQQMNHVAEMLTGWNENEACGKKIDEIFKIVNEQTSAPAVNPVASVLEKGIVIGLANHTILIARDGTRRPIADSSAPIRNTKGEITGVVLVFNDQTERRGLQDQLFQAQKMDAIGQLAGGVAHDFNNMIGVILGYAFMLEKESSPTDPSNKMLKAIISAAERSANLTKQLLAFARKQIIAPVPINLNAELIPLKKMLGRLIGEDITLNISSKKGLWDIKIDPTQITQILTNLATNARDAIENIGSVTIETVNVHIEETLENASAKISAGEYVQLIFSDTGKGMNKDTVSHIFEPFFTTKPKGEGTGLGLSTVFGIIKQNNGYINVYSEPSQGTTFKIYFPRYQGTTETSGEQIQEIPMAGGETILIVEDEAEILTLAKIVLEKYTYNVLTAQSPSEALAACEKYGKKIDLLITDVVMPGMNGKELKERIELKYPAIKVLFMSGYTADIVAHRGVLEEGVEFLQKPFTPVMLAKKVREVLNG
jgi:two-component system cell cycle sensor histidine kinase/response regulator CckA